jgi:Cyclic nucleotide-binding domain
LRDFEKSVGIEILTDALHYDLTETRSRLFYLFGFLYSPQTIHRARQALARNDTAHHAYAIELMDLILSSEHKAAFIPLMEGRSARERLNNMGAAFAEDELSKAGRIMNILHEKLALESPWVVALALELAGQFGLPSRDQALAALLNSNETMVVRLIQRTETESTMLSTVERVIILKSLSMFATTPGEALAELADVLQEVEVQAGENIVEKGAEGDSLYIIVRGKVAVLDNERIYDELGERAVFGELSLLDSAPRTATVRALEDTTLLCLAQASYYDLMTDYVEVAMGTIQMLTRSLRARTSNVVELNRMLQG